MELSTTERWQNGKIRLFLLTPDLVSDAYVGWINDHEINRYLESRFSPQSQSMVADFVSAILASDKDLFLGIFDLELGRHVGNIKLGPINRVHGTSEIGIMIGDRQAWGRGIGASAISAICDIAQHELGIRRLTAGCYASNVGSKIAFERAGFTVEAIRPGQFLLDGQPEDAVLLGKVLSEDLSID